MIGKFFAFFILFLLINCHLEIAYSATSDFETHFINVGQGHGTLITFPKGNPLLVDFGSTEFNAKRLYGVIEKNNQLFLAERIVERKDHLNVVVSHGDKDHQSWVMDFLSRLNPKFHSGAGAKPETKIKTFSFLLGGAEGDYDKDFLEEIAKGKYIQVAEEKEIKKDKKKKSTKDKKEKTPQGYFFSLEYEKDYLIDKTIDCGEGIDCRILSAIGDKSDKGSKDKNETSIVLRIASKNYEVFLTGDATEKVTDSIIVKYSKDNVLSFEKYKKAIRVLQASHHGSGTHGSNNVKWFRCVDPDYIVISAGINAGFGHPPQSVIENAMEALSEKTPHSLHFLQYYLLQGSADCHPNAGRFDNIAKFSNGFMLSITDRPIFNTASNGDITCNFRKEFKIEHQSDVTYSFSEEEILKSLSTFLNSAVGDEIIDFMLPSIMFKDGMFKALLSNLKDCKEILFLDISRAEIAKEFLGVEVIEVLVGLFTKLRRIDLPFNFAELQLKGENLQNIWYKLNKKDKSFKLVNYSSL